MGVQLDIANQGWSSLFTDQATVPGITRAVVVVVVLGFYVPPTAKVIQRWDLNLKSHPKDWRSPGSNSRPLVYNAGGLTTTPRRLLTRAKKSFFHF